MLRNEGDRLTKVVVSRPCNAYFDPGTHKANNITEVADCDETQRQYDRLTSVMKAFGAEVIDVPELPVSGTMLRRRAPSVLLRARA